MRTAGVPGACGGGRDARADCVAADRADQRGGGAVRRFEIVPLETVSETSSNASIGDVNEDGRPDIVLVKGRHWQVTTRVLFGDGKGGFTAGPALPNGAVKSYSGSLADMTKSKHLDIVLSNDQPDPKLVLINDGTGHYKVGGTYGDPKWPTRNAAVPDLTGDGFPDIAVANRQAPSYVCVNDGALHFACTALEGSTSAATVQIADVRGAGDAARVFHVVGHLRDVHVRERDPRPALLHEACHHGPVVGVEARGLHLRLSLAHPARGLHREEHRDERDHRDAAVVGEPLEDVVGDVARMVRDGTARGVGEDDGRGGRVERRVHRRRRDVRAVHEHPDPVHLAHHVAAEVVQAADRGIVGRRVRPWDVVVVRERHVARAEFPEHAQRPERRVDGVAALDAHHRADASGLEGAGHVGRGARNLERVGIAARHLVDERADVSAAGPAGRDRE